MIDILQYIPGNSKKTPSGFHSFNCPACTHNGESPDRKQRGGIKVDDAGSWGYSCFNCNFKTRFIIGKTLSSNTKNFLSWLGMPEDVIQKLNIESLRHRSPATLAEEKNHAAMRKGQSLRFDIIKLPPDAVPITPANTRQVEYLASRGLTLDDYKFYMTPNSVARNKHRIIVPYIQSTQIVGWTSRFLDSNSPRYLNEHQQPGFVFGTNLQNKNWRYAILTEGIFDAISINGLALMHNTIGDKQLLQLARLNKEIIVVPDQDAAGMQLVEDALKYGFEVSIPHWDDDVKDVNDAVVKYGRLQTIHDIVLAKEHSKIKINIAMKNISKKIQQQAEV